MFRSNCTEQMQVVAVHWLSFSFHTDASISQADSVRNKSQPLPFAHILLYFFASTIQKTTGTV